MTETAAHSVRQAAIIVGGKGTRLGALTAATPKPLMALGGGRVFLDELLANVARQGFDDILLLAGHFGEQFVERYDGRELAGARLSVLVEPAPAGTAGALAHAREALAPVFLFLNGDTMFDMNYRSLAPLLDAHPQALGALALREVSDAGRYGSVRLVGDRVAAFEEKRLNAGAGRINAGVGLFRRALLDLIDTTPLSIESDIYPRLVERGQLLGRVCSGYFIDIGLPETLEQARRDLPLRRAALFFDRDGVLNHDDGHTHRVEDLRWIEGAREIIRKANDAGALVFVVTNQAGVAKGYYTLEDVERFHAAMRRDLEAAGAFVDAFYVCPFHPDAERAQFRHPDHPDRKPNPGMIMRALAQWPVDRGRAFLVGDKDSDVEAARAAGIDAALFAGGDLRILEDRIFATLDRASDAGRA